MWCKERSKFPWMMSRKASTHIRKHKARNDFQNLTWYYVKLTIFDKFVLEGSSIKRYLKKAFHASTRNLQMVLTKFNRLHDNTSERMPWMNCPHKKQIMEKQVAIYVCIATTNSLILHLNLTKWTLNFHLDESALKIAEMKPRLHTLVLSKTTKSIPKVQKNSRQSEV